MAPLLRARFLIIHLDLRWFEMEKCWMGGWDNNTKRKKLKRNKRLGFISKKEKKKRKDSSQPWSQRDQLGTGGFQNLFSEFWMEVKSRWTMRRGRKGEPLVSDFVFRGQEREGGRGGKKEGNFHRLICELRSYSCCCWSSCWFISLYRGKELDSVNNNIIFSVVHLLFFLVVWLWQVVSRRLCLFVLFELVFFKFSCCLLFLFY